MYLRTSGFGDALTDCLQQQIIQVEGYNPNFAANNNPGNLIYVGPNQNGQTGVTKGAGGFAQFTTAASGQAALQNQIQNYINRGYTPTQFFNTYAPAGTSNEAGGQQTSAMTSNYISTVSNACGLDPNVPLNAVQASYGGVVDDGSTSLDTSTSSSGFDLSSLLSSIPGSDSTYDVGGVSISGTVLVLAAAVFGILLISDIL